MNQVDIYLGDCQATLASLPDCSVQCCVTSPPYWGLRDYGHDGQIGLEQTPEAYVARMVEVFREVRRVLRSDGTLWLNLGDSYANGGPSGPQGASGDRASRSFTAERLGAGCLTHGLKPKDLVGIPWRVAFALQADGWWLRQDIIWHKPNPMPESVQDRCTKAHEYVFLMAKSERYYYDAEAVMEEATGTGGGAFGKVSMMDAANAAGQQSRRYDRPDYRLIGRNRRSVWRISTKPFTGAHFATMPPELAELCIRAGSRLDDTILDPFGGAGTTALAAQRLQRNAILCELNPDYALMAQRRIAADNRLFCQVTLHSTPSAAQNPAPPSTA